MVCEEGLEVDKPAARPVMLSLEEELIPQFTELPQLSWVSVRISVP